MAQRIVGEEGVYGRAAVGSAGLAEELARLWKGPGHSQSLSHPITQSPAATPCSAAVAGLTWISGWGETLRAQA